MNPHHIVFHFQIEDSLEVTVVLKVLRRAHLDVVFEVNPVRSHHESVAACLLEPVRILRDVSSTAKVAWVDPSHHEIDGDDYHQDYEQRKHCSQEMAVNLTVRLEIIFRLRLLLPPSLALLLLSIKVEKLLSRPEVGLGEPSSIILLLVT